MQFTLNGKSVSYTGDLELPLLTYLRETADLISPKDGCSGQGTCGCCTVVVDGKALLGCTTPIRKVEGKSVITTEGLSTKEQDAYGDSFVEKGGVQCGFCTPGIVMRAKALLDQNAKPSREEITKSLGVHICRCTGYKKVVDSIELAAARIAGDDVPAPPKTTGRVGTRLGKYQGKETVLGFRHFVADLKVTGMLHGALRLSDHPRARVLNIDSSEALRIPGVVRVFTSKDIPGERVIGLIIRDWPLMVATGEETRYVGDVICGVVADTEETARKAAAAIKIDYEVLKPITNAKEAMEPGTPLLHKSGNVLANCEIKHGDADKALRESALVATGFYTTQRIEHAFMEPETCLAKPWMAPNGKPGVEVYSQSQGVYEDRKQIAQILGFEEAQVNVYQVQNGGAFGGKEDLSIQGQTALFAYLLGKPVRIALTRDESMLVHPKRHPIEMQYSVGCDAKGKLTAIKAEMLSDSGAYASVGMKVIERAVSHAAGGYTVPNVYVKGTACYTNNIPCGAMRGFGVNQAAFAMESCMDELCEKGGFDRWQFRWDNAITEGSMIVSGQIMKQGVGIRRCLEALKDRFKAAKYAGIATGIKNTGIGCGMADIGRAKIVVEAPNKVVVHHGWTEMGQGAYTMAVHSIVEETGLAPELIEVRVETKEETACGMTTSSRGTSLIGHAVIEACKEFKKDLASNPLSALVGKVYRGEWICDFTTKVGAIPKPDADGRTKETCTHYSYGYAAQMVELDDNGRIKTVIAAHDAGRIMNPTLFEGQIEGSVHMGLGYAITEDFPMEGGRPLHTQLNKLGILRAKETPNIDVIGIEVNDSNGPYGVKGVGEIGLVPTAGAVANALYQFDKVKRYSLPLREAKTLLGKC
ncbi:selenium-dependent xanthine dehydrogenase [Bdellovibrionota bacterium FG-2]